MTHLWVRAEERPHEARVGLTPEGAAALLKAGINVTVEDSPHRAIPIDGYRAAGAAIAAPGSWRQAPRDTIVFGLKELEEDGTPLIHRHIMFGHAYKGQPAGQVLLRRFRAGGGTLYDLEYLTDGAGRRVAAFGYWAGYAGSALSVLAWSAQRAGTIAAPVAPVADAAALRETIADALGTDRPRVLIIGALGRVGTGAGDLCDALGLAVTRWDMEETAHGGPFPEVLEHEIFLNCILATQGVPVFVPRSARLKTAPRALGVIGDIACDPTSDFSPVKVYDAVTDWETPGTPRPRRTRRLTSWPSTTCRRSCRAKARRITPRSFCPRS
jgi:saccharopine dehydrogenase (NAD+, L-lysine-forming)